MKFFVYITMFLSVLTSTYSRPISVLDSILPFHHTYPPPPLTLPPSQSLPPPPPPPPLMYRLIGADPATWSPKNAEFTLEDVSMEELITNHTLIGSNPATWSPKKNINCLEPVCNKDKDTDSNEVIIKEENITLTDNIITPLSNSINNTKIELFMKNNNINLGDIINFNALVLLQYIKDVINSAVDFGNSNNLTDLVILVVRDIEDYKNTNILNTDIYNDYKLFDYNYVYDYQLIQSENTVEEEVKENIPLEPLNVKRRNIFRRLAMI